MLRVKRSVFYEELKKYGFKRHKTNAYYFIKEDDIEVFVWCTNDEAYKQKQIYLAIPEHTLVVELPSVIYEMISDGIVEVV